MFSSRLLSFFVLLATFGLFVFAAPAAVDGLAVRQVGARADVTPLSTITELKSKVDAILPQLDGVNDPLAPLEEIVKAIHDAIDSLVTIDIHFDVIAKDAAKIVETVTQILGDISKALAKYGAEAAEKFAESLKEGAEILGQAVGALIQEGIKFVPALLNGVTGAVKAIENVLGLKLNITISILGITISL